MKTDTVWQGREPDFVVALGKCLGVMIDPQQAIVGIKPAGRSVVFSVADGLTELEITAGPSSVHASHRSAQNVIGRDVVLSPYDAVTFRNQSQELLNRVQGQRVESVLPA